VMGLATQLPALLLAALALLAAEVPLGRLVARRHRHREVLGVGRTVGIGSAEPAA
jgi:hypothetical protein